MRTITLGVPPQEVHAFVPHVFSVAAVAALAGADVHELARPAAHSERLPPARRRLFVFMLSLSQLLDRPLVYNLRNPQVALNVPYPSFIIHTKHVSTPYEYNSVVQNVIAFFGALSKR